MFGVICESEYKIICGIVVESNRMWIREGSLTGRIAWIYWFQEIPVNIKLIIEGLEEVGSYGLLELTRKRNDSFFADVDFIVISDNVWATRSPALTYGTRGSSYFFVEVMI